MDALIPRKTLFGNPRIASVQIAPDGRHLSWLAPVDGVLNVWVAPVGDPSVGQPITRDANRGIRMYGWTHNGSDLVFLQDVGGDENWQLFAVGLDGGAARPLTPEGCQAQLLKASKRHPDSLLVRINDRDPRLQDVYRVELSTGERTLVCEDPGVQGFVADDELAVRVAVMPRVEGGSQWLRREGDSWAPLLTVDGEDEMVTTPLGFSGDGARLLVRDSRGRDTGCVLWLDMASGALELVAENNAADASDVLQDPTTRAVQAVAFNVARTEWILLDDGVADSLAALGALGDVQVTSRTTDDRVWVAAIVADDAPVRYVLLDRDTGEEQPLFTSRPDLVDAPLAGMQCVSIPTRDDRTLVGYLTVPRWEGTRPKEPLPTVLLVHGGPWARSSWGFNREHQWLANRGYAVLDVNFRGSTGFGKAFVNAADRQWSKTMHHDLLDAVEWAVAQGVADKERVAIMGGSYGGYATLVGLAMTPDVFAAGVDIVGPSNLETLLATIPPYWASFYETLCRRVGDPRTPEGLAHLQDCSPLHRCADIARPLLIGQGANDPRVKQSESDQIVAAMNSAGVPVTYVLFPDEGHGFARPENNQAFFAVVEPFLAQSIGGRAAPIGDLGGATIQVPSGAAHIPGLVQALP
ncbi:MAG TPA: S9 family peptidase [Deltaproteobacteria bacterium]|nr:S9 family peptidase [Deltaproteobacteria bacterium]